MARAEKRNDDLNRASLRTSAIRPLVALAAAAIAALALFCSPALAASTHPFKESWAPGTNCNATSLDTDAQGNVYVFCTAEGTNHLTGAIRKFSPTGAPISFTYPGEYINGNEINENPFNPTEWFSHEKEWGENVHIAVPKTGPRAGYIFAAGNYLFSQDVYIFAPSGEYVASIKGGLGKGEASDVGFDQNGYIYVDFEGYWCHVGCSHISKYDPTNFHEIERMVPSPPQEPFQEPFYAPCCGEISPDSNGAVWVVWGMSWFPERAVGKIEADQWTTNLKGGYKDPNTVLAHTSPYLLEAYPEKECPETWVRSFAPYPCALPGKYIDVDLAKNEVYVDEGNKITPYSEGKAGDPVHQAGPTFGSGVFTNGRSLSIDPEGGVYVATPNTIYRFSRGFTLPTVTTKDAALEEIGHTSALVRGAVDPDGGGEITGCRVKFGETKAYSAGSSPVACDQATPYPDGSPIELSATLPNLTVGHVYHYRFEASNEHGWNIGGDHMLEARAVLKVQTKEATELHRHDVTMQGQLDADGIETEYWYEYGPTKAYGQDTLDGEGKGAPINGAPGEIEQTPLVVGHLLEGRVYHYRLVARNSLGVTYGKDMIVRTASPPGITGVGSNEITENTADLHALIDPNGNATSYRFEYGTSINYGQSLPVPDGQLSGTVPQKVEAHLEGLPTGTTVHYRVVATNKWGTTVTDDTTFNFRPPACPNAHARQVTGSSYLPDCRAYELVSPGYAGAVSLLPGEALNQFYEFFAVAGANQAPQNHGYASSPSRMMYMGSLGSVNGVDAQNSLFDLYLATRTNTGWVTSYPGLHGNEEKISGGRICSDSMDACIDHPGPLLFSGVQHPPSNSPYLYRADGTRVGRLPTNVYTVEGGTDYQGDEQISGDFSHYFFSTQTQFSPEGVTSAPGSVYDNDIAAQTVTVVSKTADGQDIAAEPAVAGDPQRVTGILGSSTDGSRVLMAGTTHPHCSTYEWPFKCPSALDWPVRLYLREANAVTYDVSRGVDVQFAGMTRDASQVFFTTAAQLLPQDEDTSADVYRWSADGDQLTLISQQGNLGNGDDCSATWTEKCGVEKLKPLHWDYSQTFEQHTYVPGTDDLIANESGDVYFYSPEDLVEGEVGGDGQRNLYLYRNGQLHLVATLEANAPIERDTISQDGSHAAFLTKSSLTSYDAKETKQVYTYNAAKGTLRCASCNPEGAAPMTGDRNVAVSESGPFMANDGRTFFTTKESLVPQDTDGIRDVYEYVEGRAQLITSGTGYRDNTGGMETVSFFFGNVDLGLEGVSRNGTDVYFSSYETLVPQDQNGEFVKIYDARAGGGFDVSPELGQCAAADECHGTPSQPAAPAVIGSGGSLGSGGNLHASARHAKKHHAKRHRKKHRKKPRSRHARNGGVHRSQRNG